MSIAELKNIPNLCKSLRILLGYSVADVANEINASTALVYSFERGLTKDMRPLMWYLHHGLELYYELVEDFYNENKSKRN